VIQFRSIRGLSMVWPLALSLLGPQSAVLANSDDVIKQTYKRPAEIPFPLDNPFTPEKAALGKALYFDPRLSGAQNMNCATTIPRSAGKFRSRPRSALRTSRWRASPQPFSTSPGSILSSGMGAPQAPRSRLRGRSSRKWK
jgi:cytochrome c peroxidase